MFETLPSTKVTRGHIKEKGQTLRRLRHPQIEKLHQTGGALIFEKARVKNINY